MGQVSQTLNCVRVPSSDVSAPPYELSSLLEDPATRAARDAILARAVPEDVLTIDLIALEAGDAIATAEASLTTGWRRRPHPQVQLVPPVNWENICASDRTWAFRLHAWEPMSEPLTAYGRTGQRRFLDWSLRLALDWVRRYPRYDHASPFAWYDMAVGMRTFRLAYLIDAGIQARRLDPETVLLLVASLRLHLHVLSLEEQFREHSNHGIYQAAGQLAAAMRMPELPEAANSAIQANERMRSLVMNHFDEEGVHREHSPGYHLMVLRSLIRLRSSGLLTDSDVLARLDRSEDAMAWLIAPVGGVPLVGDSDRLGSNLVKDPHFRNPAAEFALSQGRNGTPPEDTFRAFLPAGYFAARDGWFKRAEFERSSYLLQSCGFHSRVHKHADDLSFVWYARGTDLLTDAGRFAYAGRSEIAPELRELGFNYSDPRRIYVESTRAHNCLEIDHTSYQRRRITPYGSALVSAEHDPETGLVITEAKVTHFRTVRHTRYLFHLPGVWTLVLDHAAGGPGAVHDFVQRFHFGPDLELVSTPEGTVRLSIPNSSEQLVGTQVAQATPIEPVRGQDQPEILGFNARYPNALLSNWTTAWEQRGVRSAGFAALFAIVPEEAPFTAAGRLNATARAGQVSWQVGESRYELRWNRVEESVHEYRSSDGAPPGG